jgi:uncharacterized Zn-finger protein
MIAEQFYIEKFLTRVEADHLELFSLNLPPKRNPTAWGHPASFVGLGSWGEFPTIDRYGDCKLGPALDTAPTEVTQLAAMLSAFAGKPINILSFLAYMNERDYMGFHQHREDHIRLDQSVWVVSLGAVRAVTLRPIGCTDRRKYETIYPAHGSLYILPSMYNTTHEHEVSRSKTPCRIRVGINCKSIPAPPLDSPFVLSAETTGPRIYDCHAGCKYPADAVYVGCRVMSRNDGSVIREGTVYGNDHNPMVGHKSPIAENAGDFRKYAKQKMQDPEFRKQAIAELRNRDLLCWCKPDNPNCHAKVWLELVNAEIATK